MSRMTHVSLPEPMNFRNGLLVWHMESGVQGALESDWNRNEGTQLTRGNGGRQRERVTLGGTTDTTDNYLYGFTRTIANINMAYVTANLLVDAPKLALVAI